MDTRAQYLKIKMYGMENSRLDNIPKSLATSRIVQENLVLLKGWEALS
jgi:hypothetical protein